MNTTTTICKWKDCQNESGNKIICDFHQTMQSKGAVFVQKEPIFIDLTITDDDEDNDKAWEEIRRKGNLKAMKKIGKSFKHRDLYCFDCGRSHRVSSKKPFLLHKATWTSPNTKWSCKKPSPLPIKIHFMF